jgi:hypothetical protein
MGVVIIEEAVDRRLKIGDGSEDAAFEAALGESGEEALDGVQPRCRGRREVEGPSRMSRQPPAHGGMLVGGVIVEDRVEVEPDDVTRFVDELRIFGKLELPDAMRPKPMGWPDTLHKTHADAHRLGYRGVRPARRSPGDPRGTRLVAQQALEALGGETLLPKPHTSLGLAGLAHDRVCADALGCQKHDLRPPDVLLGAVAVLDQGSKPIKVDGRDPKRNVSSQAPDSHAASPPGIP